MKKFKTILTAVVLLLSVSSFANEGDHVSAKVKAAFENDFSRAGSVSWELKGGFYFASFTINNVSADAAYNEEGELIGTSRKVETSQLPLSVSLAISKKFEDYSLSNHALELNFEGQTNYYITIENKKQLLEIKCGTNGQVEITKKIKK